MRDSSYFVLKCFKLNRDFKRNQHLSSHFVLTLDFSSCGDPITLTVTLAIGWNIFWMGGKIELPSYAVNSLSIPSLSCFTEGSRLSGDYVEDGNFICFFFVEDSTEHSVILKCCVGSVQADELPKMFWTPSKKMTWSFPSISNWRSSMKRRKRKSAHGRTR